MAMHPYKTGGGIPRRPMGRVSATHARGQRPSTTGADGSGSSSSYYYGADSYSSRVPYLRPPWSSRRAEDYVGGTPPLPLLPAPSRNRLGGSEYPSTFFQYQSGSSHVNLGPPATAGSRYSYTTGRIDYSNIVLGGNDAVEMTDGEGFRRMWENTGIGMMLKSSASNAFNDAFRFTLMSYNILAAGLLEKNSEIYRRCDPAYLDWETRLSGIFDEIEKFNPDIVCLQEVEAAQFVLTFEKRLAEFGYRGQFKKKTGDKDDGCAIFFKSSKFLMIDKLELEFQQPHVPLLNRDNVALLLKLETKSFTKRQKLIVGTTHLLFNPKRHDVRLAQAQLLMAELDRFAFCGYDRNRRCTYHPILMTGDFNCQPHSSVTKLFCDGSLQYLDENGELIKWIKRRTSNALLPSQCGITDQCQHYKLVLERYKRWTLVKNNNFELDVKVQEPLVDIFPYLSYYPRDSSPNSTPKNESTSTSPPTFRKAIVSLYSPPGEGITASPSSVEASAAETDFLVKAAKLLSSQHSAGPLGSSLEKLQLHHYDHLDKKVLDEMLKLGLTHNFGSGRLSHGFHFRDVYASKLDRKTNEPGVTTKQSGWSCVDYIFQSMTWNDSLNKVIEGKLKLVRRLGLLSRNQCKQIGTDIPSREHPSDHFPLVAEFILR